MKKLFLLLLLPIMAFGQVGINTTTPQETLHVAGTARVDDLPLMTSDRVVVADSVGKLGYKTLTSSGGITIEVGKNVATDNLLYIPPTDFLHQRWDIDLDLDISVTVAPNTTSIIRVEYSSPLDALNCIAQGMNMLT